MLLLRKKTLWLHFTHLFENLDIWAGCTLCISSCFFQYRCFLVLDMSLMGCKCQVSDKYVKNAAVYDKCMYVRETVLGGNPVFICSPSIIAPFALLPTVPCAQVWPEMICQMRLFQRGHLWTQLQFPCSKPASHSELLKSELLTLSSVERN